MNLTYPNNNGRPSALLRQGDEYLVFYPSPAGGQREQQLLVSQREWEQLEDENRGRLVYSERDYYAYGGDGAPVTASCPPGFWPTTVNETVAQMAARGKEKQTSLAKRIDAATELVMAGRVLLVDESTARVNDYEVTEAGCDCPDFLNRGGWCKHRLATWMTRRLGRYGFGLPQPAGSDQELSDAH